MGLCCATGRRRSALSAQRSLAAAQASTDEESARKWRETLDRMARFSAEDDKLFGLEVHTGNAVAAAQVISISP